MTSNSNQLNIVSSREVEKAKFRDVSLDIMKGIAILLVVMQHTGSSINAAISFICKIDIPLFFIVSGYLAYKPNIIIKDMLINKCKTLLLPYLFALVFALVYYDISLFTLFNSIDKKGYWFLQALFVMFCFYALVYKTTNNLKSLLLELFLIELLLLLGTKFSSSSIDSWLGLGYIARYFPCFFAGMIIHKYNVKGIILIKYYGTLGLVCIFVTTFAFTNHLSTNYNFLIYVCGYLTCAFFSFFFIRYIYLEFPQKLQNFFSYLGRYSLPIYIIHFYFIWRIPNYFDSFIPNIVLTVAVSVVIIYVCIGVSKLLTFATPVKNIFPN